jgi:plasmid stabilization system protein ParE
MKRVELQPLAKADLAEADSWYEAQVPGLGDEFLDELQRTTGLIGENPHQYPETEAGARKARLRRFPYIVVYLDEPDSVQIVAVVHAHRHPRVWKDRLR